MHRVLLKGYQALSEQLRSFDRARAQQHPGGDEKAWSARNVVEHLLATYATCTLSLDARIEKGRPLESKRTLKALLMQWVLIDVGYFPPGRQAPQTVRPGVVTIAPQAGAEMSALLHTAISRLDEALNRVAAIYPARPVVNHMVLGPLSVRQWRKFHGVHARLHAKQLRRVNAAIAADSMKEA